MRQLQVEEYGRIMPLIEKNETQGIPAAVYSVLEGTCPGRVLADDLDEPRLVIVDVSRIDRSPLGLCLFGDPDPAAFRSLVPKLLSGHLPANGKPVWSTSQTWRGEGTMLWATSVAWREVLQSLFSVRQARLVFEFRPFSWAPAPDWRERVPADFVLRPIHELPIGWEGKDVDPEKSFGFCVLSGDQVVSRCHCEFLGRREAEITIRTDVAFQRRGLAALTCTAFIEECLANGLRPAWSCDATNTASAGLAQRLGFTKSFDLVGYFLHPSFQVLDGRWGPPLIPDIRGYDEAAICREVETIVVRALDAGVSALSLVPGRQGASVWHHIDGAPREVAAFPREVQDRLYARFKCMADMNIDEQGWPQFGRWAVTHNQMDFDFRLTCLPSTYGDEIFIHPSGRPPLKLIHARTRAGEEIWMHRAEEQRS